MGPRSHEGRAGENRPASPAAAAQPRLTGSPASLLARALTPPWAAPHDLVSSLVTSPPNGPGSKARHAGASGFDVNSRGWAVHTNV